MELSADISLAWVMALALASVRSAAFVATCALVPRGVSPTIRGAYALALAIAVSGAPAGGVAVPEAAAGWETSELIVLAATNAVVGGVLGWLVGLGAHIFGIAGGAIDTMSGLTIGAVFDPGSQSSVGPLSRFFAAAGQTLFVAAGGLILLAQIFAVSVDAIALDGNLGALSALGPTATRATGRILLLGVELALPILAVLFCIEVAFGLVSRLVPQLNAFLVGLPVKMIALLAMLGGISATFPHAVDAASNEALSVARTLFG